VAVGLIVWLGFDSGGYASESFLRAGIVAMVAVGALLIARRPTFGLSTESLVGLAALVGLAIWAGLSSNWSEGSGAAVQDMQRTIMYAGVFGLALMAAGSGRFASKLALVVLLAVTVVVGAGLLSRFYPDVLDSKLASAYRLAYPLGYWNAYGGLAAMGAVLGLGLAADPRGHVWVRGACAGAAVLLSVAVYLSLSRGAWLALIVGIVVLVAIGAHHGSLLLTAGVVGGFSAIAIARLQSYGALIDDPSIGAGQLSQGHEFGPQLIILVAAAVTANAVIAAGRQSRGLMGTLGVLRRPALLVAVVVIGVGGLGIYAVRGRTVEGRSSAKVVNIRDFVSKQWHDFMRPASGAPGTLLPAAGRARLTSSRGSRIDLYRIAWREFRDHPIAGAGSGSFRYQWLQQRPHAEYVTDGHSLYLETADELGLVGLLLLAAFIGSIARAVFRARTVGGALGRSQAAAIGAALTVWVVHAGIDWDWEVPGFTAAALVLAACVYPYGRRSVAARAP
jgi:O-antigen ligase